VIAIVTRHDAEVDGGHRRIEPGKRARSGPVARRREPQNLIAATPQSASSTRKVTDVSAR